MRERERERGEDSQVVSAALEEVSLVIMVFAIYQDTARKQHKYFNSNI